MSQDPFNPYNLGKGTRSFRRRAELSARTPEQITRDIEAKKALREQRRAFLRRLFRRG